jgi:HKD family nuclease
LTTSGVATLINTIVELQNKNVKGKILVSQYLNFTEPKALENAVRNRKQKKIINIFCLNLSKRLKIIG